MEKKFLDSANPHRVQREPMGIEFNDDQEDLSQFKKEVLPFLVGIFLIGGALYFLAFGFSVVSVLFSIFGIPLFTYVLAFSLYALMSFYEKFTKRK